jgi:hypothetical protein
MGESLFRGKAPLLHSGPYLAEVVNHLDGTYMGGLEVLVTKGLSPNYDIQERTYSVKYLSPFYGVTSIRYEGNNSNDFNDVQKSYGMWMVPPDVGTTVLVIFIEGDANQGYWIGCVPDIFQNNMVPGIAASEISSMTADQIQKYGTTYLPVAEIHKKSQLLNSGPAIDKIPRAIHPFANRLLNQGLLLDTARGPTSSSARRELPSSVFGISTPGPLDTSNGAKKGKIGFEGNTQAFVSRLGGSTFVMDDGDINGQNELVRIRTRTGHQILLHNSQDLIYIANANGTAWLEMTSSGKIDIYAADSVSIHSENDINIRADRDVNIEAMRNLNMVSAKGVQIESSSTLAVISNDDMFIQTQGKLNIESTDNLDLNTMASANMSSLLDFNIQSTSTSSSMNIAGGDINIEATTGSVYQGAKLDFNISGDMTSGTVYISANTIQQNGIPATPPTISVIELPSSVDILPRWQLPNRDPSTDWIENYYKTSNIVSIMSRVPTYEPYDQHENNSSTQFNSINTDVKLPGGPLSQVM